jgi:hypothetical protein
MITRNNTVNVVNMVNMASSTIHGGRDKEFLFFFNLCLCLFYI